MADPQTQPLEITITPKPGYAPDIANDGPAAAPPREFGQDAGDTEGGSFGDGYLRLAQLEKGRAAREMLEKMIQPEVKPGAAGGAAGPGAPPPAMPSPSTAEGAATRGLGSRILSGMGAVASDVGRGIMQAPRAAVEGAGEAVRQVADTAASLGEWLSTATGGVLGPVSLDEYRRLMKAEGREADAAKPDAELWKEIEKRGQKLLTEIVPTLGKPDTVTAGLVHDVSQFVTGMALGGKVLKAANVPLKGAKRAAATGAFSDFAAQDPDAKRLADLVQKYPAMQNPVADFMQAKPDDNEAVKRLKAAAEGLGLGALTEGFIRGTMALRAKMATGGETEPGKLVAKMEAEAEAKFGKLSEEAMAILGDPKAPLVKALTEGQKASIAAKKLEAGKSMAGGVSTGELVGGLVKTTDAGGKEVYVNFARIEAAEDVKKVIGLMADAGKAKIDAKRGGEKVTFEAMEDVANSMNMTVGDLLARRAGSPMNAGEALAARSLLAASATNLTVMANRIASGAGGPAMDFAFRRQMAVHAAIQSEVIAARTETARALASWRIPRGGGLEASRAVQETLNAMGGSATTRDLALKLSQIQAAKPNSIGPMSEFVRKSVTNRTLDAAMEAWKSAMLSGPTTHLSNMMSNTLTASIAIPERKLAEMIGAFRGTADGVAAGEANALAHGLVNSSKDAMRMAWMALKTGESEFGRAAGKADLTPQRAISSEALGLPDNVWGNSIDYIGKGFQVPFRLLTAEDEFFKTMTFRAELHAQAHRVASSEGLSGAAASSRMKEIIDNPPEVVKMAAADFAKAATYTRELTGAMAAVARARGGDDVGARALQLVLPFFNTPVNVFTSSVERSPLAFLTEQFRADVKAGGARADLALARMATGTTAMLIAADLADQGLVTGMIAKDPDAKEARTRQKIEPYSVKIGDKWYSYNKLDPLAMPMAVAANMAELMRRYEIEPDKLDSFAEIVAATIGGTAKAALDRSFMQGAAGLISAIEDPEQHANQYIKSQVASFVTPALSNTVAKLADPTQRETFSPLDAIEARIVGLSKTLIPRMDLWGREVRIPESGLGRGFDVISPIKVSEQKPNPIDAELIRLNSFPNRIAKKGSWDGAPVEFSNFPEVYAEYARLAGNGVKLPQYEGLGAMDFLNALVEGRTNYGSAADKGSYWGLMTDGKEGGKAQFIAKVIGDYRKEARREIERDPRFSEFRQYLAQQSIDAAVKKAKTEPEREAAPMMPRLQ